MPLLLFLAFIGVPLLELWVILEVGDLIGGWWTVVVLALDSILGAVIVRREGRRAWAAFREALSELRWPGDEVAQGALVLVGGALLLTPGFVTDVLGLSFVLPLTRPLWSRLVRARTTVLTVDGLGGIGSGGASERGDERSSEQDRGRSRPRGRDLDVEVLRVERNTPPRAPELGDEDDPDGVADR